MNKFEFSISDITQLPQAAETILQFSADLGRGEKFLDPTASARMAGTPKIFAFYAPMGAGKTTLIKEICRQLGSHDNFSSPSYSIVNEYAIEGSTQKIYHIDLYRIKDIEEALSAGIEEYLNGENYCFIEWPELIQPLLPANTLKINIAIDENIRNVTIFVD